MFSYIPLLDWSAPWSDYELFRKFNLSQDEINYVESIVKDSTETLFDSNELIDPNFGEFNLLDYGVKDGDTLVYTPTGQELTVCENNQIELSGERFTLAQFTAKYMPRNKRSISGFCQGPKYFTYNGVSLYKLKESFLGGEKTHKK